MRLELATAAERDGDGGGVVLGHGELGKLGGKVEERTGKDFYRQGAIGSHLRDSVREKLGLISSSGDREKSVFAINFGEQRNGRIERRRRRCTRTAREGGRLEVEEDPDRWASPVGGSGERRDFELHFSNEVINLPISNLNLTTEINVDIKYLQNLSEQAALSLRHYKD
uniref:Uncharacterized protein n=1 Tax=Oryza meridionalis TaxID=40149 RepID=A0A0E0C472_9ORYZ